ncbi:unnamed protein product [Ilex paraguariensis]|uniref:Uncharacterized protein n=1 Tax=Ilex paraguariensis TaxID=185542 RepID=A0ABC8TGS2_9AQUA
MAEKLGRLELDSKFKDKGEFEQTEQALFDLDGRFRQANDTIKEKEYLIFNLLGSEKALTERAFELQAELENAASEMSILFTKIEHKNNMEDRNRILIQNFHSGLAQQLEVLNEAVVASVTQQEQQLKVIEQNTLSFLPAKAGATAELQTQLRKLQELYGSGIKTLDDVAGELDQNSLLTCHNLKSEVSKNSSCLGDLIREISLEAKAILNDLQINLTNQGERVAAFAQQQHEGEFEQTEQALFDLDGRFRQANDTIKEKEYLIFNLLGSEVFATAELQTQLRKLQELYGSGIKTLDDVAGELDQNSLLTCHNLKSEVSKNSSCLGDLIREISLEAKAILNDLQINLTNQGERVAAFAQQQHESCSRTYQATQSISRLTVNFFKTLSMHVSKLTLVVAEEETIEDQKLCALEKKFEEYTANEERQILDKVAELLASSNARMKNMATVDDLRECTSSRTSKLHQEMSNMQDLTSSAKGEWTSYLGKTETQYIEDTTSVVNGKDGLEEGLRQCMTKARLIAEQWRKAQDSALSLQRRNIDSVDTIVQNGVEGNQKIKAQFSAVVSSTLGESDFANINLLSSVEDLLRLDQYAFEKINSLIGPSCEAMKEAEISHFHIVSEIMVNAGKCLMNDYMVDGPSCSTPRKRAFNIPTMACIEDLRTPAFEGLLKSFREAGLGRQANGKVQTAVDDLRECTSSRTSKLHQEMSNMQDLTSSAKGEWTSYLGKTETQYIEDTTSVVNGKDGLEEGLRQCMTKARLIAEQWRKAQDSALSLQRRNIDSVDTIVQNGVEGNQKIKAQFSAVVSSTLGESDVANINLLSSVEDLLRLDQYAFEKINSLIGPSCEAMKEAEISHFHIVSEIMVNAGKCLMNDYMVDGPSCSTPRKRAFNIPTMACIEDLRTPAFEGLLKSFREAGLGRQANGKVNNHQECMHPFSPSAPEILSGQLREELEQQNLQ